MVMRAGDCARQSVIISPVLVCFWQRVRLLSLLTQKVIKNATPTLLAMWIQSGHAFRMRLESSRKQNYPNRVDNYGIFELDHNTSMRSYTLLGNLSTLGNPIEIIEEYNGSCLACWPAYLLLFYDALQRTPLLLVLRRQQEWLDVP